MGGTEDGEALLARPTQEDTNAGPTLGTLSLAEKELGWNWRLGTPEDNSFLLVFNLSNSLVLLKYVCTATLLFWFLFWSQGQIPYSIPVS